MVAHIKKGDKVVVLTGRDKGKTGEVLKTIPARDRAIVQGVNMVSVTPRRRRPAPVASSKKKLPFMFPTWPMWTRRMTSRPASAPRFWKMAAVSAMRSGPAK